MFAYEKQYESFHIVAILPTLLSFKAKEEFQGEKEQQKSHILLDLALLLQINGDASSPAACYNPMANQGFPGRHQPPPPMHVCKNLLIRDSLCTLRRFPS